MVSRADSDDPIRQPALRFLDILSNVYHSYVDSVNVDSLVDRAVFGMLSSLDPHTVYLPPEQTQELAVRSSGRYVGVGVELAFADGGAYVLAVSPGGPADSAGIRPFDRLLSIDGAAVSSLSAVDVRARMRGEPGSTVSLQVESTDGALRDVAVVRGEVAVPSVMGAVLLDNRVGYVRLASFSHRTPAELDSALALLAKKKARSLILDLRGNVGGVAAAGAEAAARFLPDSTVVARIEGRKMEHVPALYAVGAPKRYDWPLVVLVDRRTGSASEILAGALQDLDRAVVVGERTFGKGLIQTDIPLSNGGRLVLTVGRYTTPLGRVIQRPFRSGEFEAYYESPSLGDTARYATTAAGRRLSGGGGIAPDVAFVEDRPSSWSGRLDDAAIVAAREITDASWRKRTPVALVAEFPRDRIASAFERHLAENGVALPDGERAGLLARAEQVVLVYIARALWGPDAAAEVEVWMDPITPVALRALDRARDLLTRARGG